MAERRAASAQETKEETEAPVAIPVGVRPFTWLDPGTWPASLRFLPVYVALLAVFIAIYYARYMDSGIDMSTYESCVGTISMPYLTRLLLTLLMQVGSFNYTFRINAALHQAHDHSRHSWEIGYAYEATQQIYNPERSVFGPNPFPKGKVPSLTLRLDEASLYVQAHVEALRDQISWNQTRKQLFEDENGAVSDPAALGVAVVQFAQRWGSGSLMEAAARQKDVLLEEAPRYGNDAISHRFEGKQLWSHAIAMFPPFLAYYAVATDDLDLMKEAVRQIRMYRDVLMIKDSPGAGLWKHIASESIGESWEPLEDAAAWTTGNGWAAYGMARTRATIASWSKGDRNLVDELDTYVGEILDAVIKHDDDHSGLLRNYIDDSTSQAEASGTALLAATVYRMAVLRKDVFAQPKYLDWAHAKRRTIFENVDDDGFLRPVVDPFNPSSGETIDVSAEGQSFLLLLGTAWRDCVCSSPNGICLATYMNETGTELAGELTFENLTGYTFQDLIAPITTRYSAIIKYFRAP